MGLMTGAAIVGAAAAVGGAAVSYTQGKSAKEAAADAQRKEDARIAEQERLIAEEEAAQLKVADERVARLKQNELLSGSETGATATSPTLLGAT